MTMPSNIIFVGGPGSGKSNYLFRTWIAIERKKGRLVKNGLPDELEYLHDGSSVLLDGKFAPHTSKDTRKVCQIPIALRDNADSRGVLFVPDATGELWLDLYRNREWPIQWDDLVTKGCGFILFVCVGSPHNVPALDWISCERIYGSGASAKPTEVPTQVLLVEWLQILRWVTNRKVGHDHIPRLSVVIAAWDRIPADRRQEKPENYLDTEFPLFAQFIRSEIHGFEAKVFGLSIVGGDLELDPEFQRAYRQSEPSDFGYSVSGMQSGIERSGDVLMPIYWALGLDT